MWTTLQTGLLQAIILLFTSELSFATGCLQVHPQNPRYFADPSGKAVWLTGSHTWANFQERGVKGRTADFDYERYLDFLERHGHNFVRMWRWEHAKWMQFASAATAVRYEPMAYERTGPGIALDGLPTFDLTRFDQAYFDRLRRRVAAAGQRGIYVSVMLFQGFSVEQKGTPGVDPNRGNPWDGHPYNARNNVNGVDGDLNGDGEGIETHTLANPAVTRLQEDYIRKVVDTLNDLDNVLWEISNESHPKSIDWQYHMIRFLRECEASQPKRHLIGMTSSPINNPPLFDSPADWICPQGKDYLSAPPDAAGRKIVIVDTDHIAPWDSEPAWVWKNFMRGNHFILMDSYLDFRVGSPPEPDPKQEATRRAMGFVRQLAETVELASFEPHPELSSTRYCLAAAGREYLVYQPEGGRELTLSLEPGEYHVRWWNCSTNARSTGGEIEGTDHPLSFVAPFDQPAVLYLTLRTPDSGR
jgi:hypothetical protein